MNNETTDGGAHVPCIDLLDELLWRLRDIREDLMSTGIGGRCYNCDEWSTPVVNLTSAIKLIESNNLTEGEIRTLEKFEAEEMNAEFEKELNAEFEKELTHLINRHSIENEVDMPDFLLARMLCAMIESMMPTPRVRL